MGGIASISPGNDAIEPQVIDRLKLPLPPVQDRFIPIDYKSKIYPKDNDLSFYHMTRGLNIFDNMILSLLAEAGGAFTVVYLSLLIYSIKCLFRNSKINGDVRLQNWFIFAILIGFFSHSMTFDSLKFPNLNWLFHSVLALAVNYAKKKEV